jgi:hypothetical protein
LNKSGNRFQNVTQIFDNQTKLAIQDIERFFKEVVQDRIYWRRDILQFFGIEGDDLSAFLKYHQKYKLTLKKLMEEESSRLGTTMPGVRAGSYYVRDGISNLDMDSDVDFMNKDIPGNESFKVNITNY